MKDKKKDTIHGQDMGLRYNNQVLKIEIVINTDADPHKLARVLYNKARGPRLDAAVVMIAGYDGEDGKEIWDEVQEVARSNTPPS